jgi:hypothetical protein
MTMTTSQVSARLRFEVWERTRAQHASLLAHLMDTNTTYEQGAPALSLLSLSLPLHLSPRTPPAPPCHPPLAPFCVPTGKYLAIVAGAVVGKEVRFDLCLSLPPLSLPRLSLSHTTPSLYSGALRRGVPAAGAGAPAGLRLRGVRGQRHREGVRRTRQAPAKTRIQHGTKSLPDYMGPRTQGVCHLLPSPRSVPLCGHMYM